MKLLKDPSGPIPPTPSCSSGRRKPRRMGGGSARIVYRQDPATLVGEAVESPTGALAHSDGPHSSGTH